MKLSSIHKYKKKKKWKLVHLSYRLEVQKNINTKTEDLKGTVIGCVTDSGIIIHKTLDR